MTTVAITIEPSDFWSSRELMTIETALGCKFNCTFVDTITETTKTKLNNIDTIIGYANSIQRSRYWQTFPR